PAEGRREGFEPLPDPLPATFWSANLLVGWAGGPSPPAQPPRPDLRPLGTGRRGRLSARPWGHGTPAPSQLRGRPGGKRPGSRHVPEGGFPVPSSRPATAALPVPRDH